MQFVVISVRSAVGSSRFRCAARSVRLDISQRAARAVCRFLRVGRTFRFDLVRSGFASGRHASVVSTPAHMRWASFTRRAVA